MKQKIKQYFYDSHDLRYGLKAPNDFSFWYFLLLDFPIEFLCFLFLSILFGKAFLK